MNKTKLLGLSITAVFTALLVTGPTSAFAGNGVDPQLDIESATVFENPIQVSAKINVNQDITLTGAKGTGILVDNSLAVSTTHGGVFDSAMQANKDDPIQHNHYVDLTAAEGQCITENPNIIAAFQVAAISHQSPGIAMWPENMYKIWEVPKVSPDGYTDFFTTTGPDNGGIDPGNLHTFTLGALSSPPQVVSFELAVPFFAFPDEGIPGQVCVWVVEITDATLEDLVKVGGLPMVIDSNALILAGIQSTAMWMIPVLAGAAGAGAYYIKTRMNKE